MSVQSEPLQAIVGQLVAYRGAGALNQYRDRDPALDRPDAPQVRRHNLRAYLERFAGARYLLVGEAAGYAGCRFSGIPFTGEAQIVGPEALPWTRSLDLAQSSLGDPWHERSGSIVWEAFAGRLDCALWNTFPWHPHGESPLSNRTPTRAEIEAGGEVLRAVLAWFDSAEVYAVGRISERALAALGVQAAYIRHPAHGGKARFTAAVRALPRAEQ